MYSNSQILLLYSHVYFFIRESMEVNYWHVLCVWGQKIFSQSARAAISTSLRMFTRSGSNCWDQNWQPNTCPRFISLTVSLFEKIVVYIVFFVCCFVYFYVELRRAINFFKLQGSYKLIAGFQLNFLDLRIPHGGCDGFLGWI